MLQPSYGTLDPHFCIIQSWDFGLPQCLREKSLYKLACTPVTWRPQSSVWMKEKGHTHILTWSSAKSTCLAGLLEISGPWGELCRCYPSHRAIMSQKKAPASLWHKVDIPPIPIRGCDVDSLFSPKATQEHDHTLTSWIAGGETDGIREKIPFNIIKLDPKMTFLGYYQGITLFGCSLNVL